MKTIPAVREALEEDKWSDAESGAAIAGKVLMNEAKLVDSIAQQVEQQWAECSGRFCRELDDFENLRANAKRIADRRISSLLF